MINRYYIICLVVFILIDFLQISVLAQDSSKEELLKIVVLSRHGARAPLQNHDYLEKWTKKQLPYWNIKKGYLTQHGSMLVTVLWEQMYDILGLEAFFPKNTCPNSKLIYVYANNRERTQATATAILNGLVPGCNIPYYIMEGKELDPVFLPFDSKSLSVNLDSISKEVEQYYGGIDALKIEFREPLQEIVNICGVCPEDTCKGYNLSPGCTILDIPTTIELGHTVGTVKLSGGLKVAGTMVENLFLSYIQWPNGNLSEFKASSATIKKILPIHSKLFAITNRIPLVAQCKGSSLLENITAALTNTSKNKQMNKAKLVVFVGHDTNIVTVSSLLSLFWDVGGYPPNEPALGGFLAFSLWKTPKGDVVRVHYVCQSIDTLLNKKLYPQEVLYEPLCLLPFAQPNSQPSKAQVFECSKDQFICWVKSVIDKKYVPSKFVPLKAKYSFD